MQFRLSTMKFKFGNMQYKLGDKVKIKNSIHSGEIVFGYGEESIENTYLVFISELTSELTPYSGKITSDLLANKTGTKITQDHVDRFELPLYCTDKYLFYFMIDEIENQIISKWKPNSSWNDWVLKE